MRFNRLTLPLLNKQNLKPEINQNKYCVKKCQKSGE